MIGQGLPGDEHGAKEQRDGERGLEEIHGLGEGQDSRELQDKGQHRRHAGDGLQNGELAGVSEVDGHPEKAEQRHHEGEETGEGQDVEQGVVFEAEDAELVFAEAR